MYSGGLARVCAQEDAWVFKVTWRERARARECVCVCVSVCVRCRRTCEAANVRRMCACTLGRRAPRVMHGQACSFHNHFFAVVGRGDAHSAVSCAVKAQKKVGLENAREADSESHPIGRLLS
jgi:hypothetical protein